MSPFVRWSIDHLSSFKTPPRLSSCTTRSRRSSAGVWIRPSWSRRCRRTKSAWTSWRVTGWRLRACARRWTSTWRRRSPSIRPWSASTAKPSAWSRSTSRSEAALDRGRSERLFHWSQLGCTVWHSASVNREIEYLKKEDQRCAQVGAEASLLKEESGQLQEQVRGGGDIVRHRKASYGIVRHRKAHTAL